MESAGTLNVARLGVVDYAAALALQDAAVAARTRDEIGDALLLLEHPHVFTLGRGADQHYITNPPDGVPIYRVSRGGQVTYHGPGQLIGYSIVKLTGTERDVSRYLRRLEQTMIRALDEFGIEAGRRDGMTGVWVGARKIASIGVGIRRWVTLHGFALNVTTDLSYFDAIVPCGIEGCRMTSIADLGNSQVSAEGFAGAIARSFAAVFGYGHIEAAAPDRIWALLESADGGCEARR
jgi:lipoate-protein ligase B